MNRLLLIVVIIALIVSLASCVEREQTKPEDVSEFVTVLVDDEGCYAVRIDKELDTQLTEEHGEYTITRTRMSDSVWTYKFFDKMDVLIAYANVAISKPTGAEV